MGQWNSAEPFPAALQQESAAGRNQSIKAEKLAFQLNFRHHTNFHAFSFAVFANVNCFSIRSAEDREHKQHNTVLLQSRG